MLRISSAARLSFGLVVLTTSILLVADTIGLIPSRTKPIIEERKRIGESLAIYCSVSAQKKDHDSVRNIVKLISQKYEDILSAAVRNLDGTLLAEGGDHGRYWQEIPKNASMATHVRVPIFEEDNLWGTVEISFNPIGRWGVLGTWADTLTKLIIFVMLCGFIVYRLFLKATLKQLDPTSVVPSRVKTALDSLAEGIVILEKNSQIVFANEVFAKKVGVSESSLVGRNMSEFNWTAQQNSGKSEDYPWIQALHKGKNCAGVRLCLKDNTGNNLAFMVKGSPILDDTGKCRGVLTTFDDVTKLEEQNSQLKIMLDKLEKSQDEVELKNKKLKILATRDPLTGCFNRRAFFEISNLAFSNAKTHGQALSCVMFDLDHFKSINDRHGHAGGDLILKGVSNLVRSSLRKSDIFGRYGGEEFCIFLRDTDIENAAKMAERFRRMIETHDFGGIQASASFGVSGIECGAKEVSELVDQADQQLYKAKNNGRNRVEGMKIAYNYDRVKSKYFSSDLTEDNQDTTCEVKEAHFNAAQRNDASNLVKISKSETPGVGSKKEQLKGIQPESKMVRKAKTSGASNPTSLETGPISAEIGTDREIVSIPKTGKTHSIDLVREALKHSGKISESMGLQTSLNREGDAVIQLNKDGGWGDQGKGGPQNRNHASPISVAANVLKQSKGKENTHKS